MRVIAGSARRLVLKTPPGRDTRPTTDRIKETLFNIIQPYIPDSRFLDLFSGSGGIGIEALSRGAATAVFVENDSRACECIRQNLTFTKLENNGRLLRMDVLGALKSLEGQPAFDIIFMDPPYKKGFEPQVLSYLAESSLVDEDTLIIAEEELHEDFSFADDLGFEIARSKEYKTNKHVFLRKNRE